MLCFILFSCVLCYIARKYGGGLTVWGICIWPYLPTVLGLYNSKAFIWGVWTCKTTRTWPIHRQHSPSEPIVGQSEPSEPSANDDKRWPVRANVSRRGYSPNWPCHGLYRPPMQFYSRFRTVSGFDETRPFLYLSLRGWTATTACSPARLRAFWTDSSRCLMLRRGSSATRVNTTTSRLSSVMFSNGC